MAPVPIHIVREDGRIERLGEWRAPVLALERAGFPLLGPGEHVIEGDLPWVFWEMCPSGFLGRAFARRYPELSLPSDPRLWRPDDCLRALAHHGGDLAGNLIVGDESLTQFDPADTVAAAHGEFMKNLFDAQGEIAQDAGGSSLGGDRPKIATGRFLFKYSPPLPTSLGARWADLLRTEMHCLSALSANGVPAVTADTLSIAKRLYLRVRRYDRVGHGRRGATTLYYYAVDMQPVEAPEVVRRLIDEGHLPEAAFDTCTRIHEFSLAIGNTDAHLGNYGLTFDEQGRASLAPAFDVLPMVLAPRNDELPDAYIRPRAAPIPERTRPLVEDLARRIDADAEISSEFKALWHLYVGV